jgi:hypothetical protein
VNYFIRFHHVQKISSQNKLYSSNTYDGPKRIKLDDEDIPPPPPPSSGSGEWSDWDTDNYVGDDFGLDADDDGDTSFLKPPAADSSDESGGGANDEVEYDLEGDPIERSAWSLPSSGQKSSSSTAPEKWLDWSEEANYFDDEPDDSNDDRLSEEMAEEFVSDPTRLRALANFASTASLPPSSDIFASSWNRGDTPGNIGDKAVSTTKSPETTSTGSLSELLPLIVETNRLLGILDAKTSADAAKSAMLIEKLSAQVEALKLLVAGSIGTSIAVLIVLAGK